MKMEDLFKTGTTASYPPIAEMHEEFIVGSENIEPSLAGKKTSDEFKRCFHEDDKKAKEIIEQRQKYMASQKAARDKTLAALLHSISSSMAAPYYQTILDLSRLSKHKSYPEDFVNRVSGLLIQELKKETPNQDFIKFAYDVLSVDKTNIRWSSTSSTTTAPSLAIY